MFLIAPSVCLVSKEYIKNDLFFNGTLLTTDTRCFLFN